MRYRDVMRQFLDGRFAKHIAVGQPNIRTGTITFRYKDDCLTLRGERLDGGVRMNGTFYEMPAKKFMELKNGLRRTGK